jgi:hypothetical protein
MSGSAAAPRDGMYVIERRTEMYPVSGLNDRQELLAFFQGEYRELQRLVGRFRVRGTENGNNSDASFIASERECNNSVCVCDPLPKSENVMPAAVAHAQEELG